MPGSLLIFFFSLWLKIAFFTKRVRQSPVILKFLWMFSNTDFQFKILKSGICGKLTSTRRKIINWDNEQIEKIKDLKLEVIIRLSDLYKRVRDQKISTRNF